MHLRGTHVPFCVALVSLVLSGCDPFELYARPIDAEGKLAASPFTRDGLAVHGEEETGISNGYFGVVVVTFENHSPAWSRVIRMNVTFGGPQLDGGVLVPEGEALQSWGRATVQRERVRTNNEQLVLAAITGMDTPAARDPDPVRSATRFPNTHLLSVPFSVPPKMYARRWIVLNTGPTSPCVNAMLLDFTLENGHRERLWLDFRATAWNSQWQRDKCRPAAQPRPPR